MRRIWCLLLAITVIFINISKSGAWYTNYRVNDGHNGYLDIGNVTFNPSNLHLSYIVDTECTNDYALFANGRIFCVSNNRLFSYYPQNGSISFWQLAMSDEPIFNPTFASFQDISSVIIYYYVERELYLSAFDPISGELKKTINPAFTWIYKYTTNPVGTPDGNISSSNWNSNEVPVVCDGMVAVSAYNAETQAYNVDDLENEIWQFPAPYSGSYQFHGSIPVCFQNKNGYRMIVKPLNNYADQHYENYNCYVLDVLSGTIVNQFACDTLPIFHYDKHSGIADIVIFEITTTNLNKQNQIVAAMMKDDQIIYQELWRGEGDLDYSFIVDDYLVIGTKTGNTVKIYNVYNGDILWEETYPDTANSGSSSGSTFVFGGLVEGEDHNMEFMVVIKFRDKLYAYKELET
eukprot:440012_1